MASSRYSRPSERASTHTSRRAQNLYDPIKPIRLPPLSRAELRATWRGRRTKDSSSIDRKFPNKRNRRDAFAFVPRGCISRWLRHRVVGASLLLLLLLLSIYRRLESNIVYLTTRAAYSSACAGIVLDHTRSARRTQLAGPYQSINVDLAAFVRFNASLVWRPPIVY